MYMNNGVSIFCILLLIYLILAGIMLILGYDITNNRLVVFISLVAMISSLIDLFNVFKSKAESEFVLLNKVYGIQDKISEIKRNLERKYDYGRLLFEDYVHQVFRDYEIEKISRNRLTEEEKKSYCEMISSYEFDNTNLKEMIKNFVNIEIVDEVKSIAEDEDYSQIDAIIKKLQMEIYRWQILINIVTSTGVFTTIMVMIYFDNLISVLPHIDLNVSIFSFIIIICSIIIKGHRDPELEDIENKMVKILELMGTKDK